MKKLREEYAKIVWSLDGDIVGRARAVEYVNNSDIYAHGTPVPFNYIPNLIDAKGVKFFEETCETIHTILCKIIRHYLDDPEYRKIFGYSKELDDLMLSRCDYDELLPLARFDLFLNEETGEYKFCEFNTDGSGAMSRDFELGNALKFGETYKRFAENHKVEQFELFDSWVDAFMQNYRQCPYAKETPTIAVTDFEESGVFSDFNRFIEAFKRAGYPARFVDTRAFEFDGEKLSDPSDGTQIDAIYRRAVTSEMLTHPGECDALINAVKAGKVCLIGHWRNTVVHTKVVNIAMFDPATRAFLTQEECDFIDAHVPKTYRWTSSLNSIPEESEQGEISAPELVEVRNRANFHTKDSWILKPSDDYASHGVFCGIEMTQEDWDAALEKCLDSNYIIQEYYLPHKALGVRCEPVDENGNPLDPAQASPSNYEPVKEWEYMPGLYCYNGKFVGMYCRHGQGGIIALDHGGLCSNSYKVDC